MNKQSVADIRKEIKGLKSEREDLMYKVELMETRISGLSVKIKRQQKKKNKLLEEKNNNGNQ